VPLTLYFLRHGQTASSRDNVFCGSGSDPELTEAGLEMARAFADAYRSTRWTGVYCSPLKRTIATARPLCDELGLEPVRMEGLTEIGYGRWEGRTVEAVRQDHPDDYRKWLYDPAWNPPTGGETAVDVATRSMKALQEIKERHSSGDDEHVLAVSHKATIRILLCNLLGIDIGRFRYRLGCPVGSVSAVELALEGPLLTTLANRSHLSEELRRLPGT
jgi:probable phosphoglycerate mutase